MMTVDSRDTHLTTRQLWVLLAVADHRVDRSPLYGGICTIGDRSVTWAVAMLALRGLIAFDPMLPSDPHVTRRGQTVLRFLSDH